MDYSEYWARRLESLGTAQSRYIWALIISGVFYVSLSPSALSDEAPTTVKAPLLDIELSSVAVWASGPAILSLLVLVILGSMRAANTAHRALTGGDKAAGEALDTVPNAIDLAVYSTDSTHKVIRWIFGLTYPAILSVFVVEAHLLLVQMATSFEGEGWVRWVGFPSAMVTAMATVQLLRFWRHRVRAWNES